MRVSFVICFLILVCSFVANAQEPLPAGRTSVAHVEVGYSYADVAVPSTGRLGMSGIDFGVTIDISHHFGLDLAGNYVRGPHILVVNQPTHLLTYTAGVAVYPLETRHLSIRARALFGGAKQEGANLGSHGTFLTGIVNQTALLLGGAVDYKLDRSWSIRFAADYLRSSFFNPVGAIVPQNSFRTGIGIVYTMGASHQRR